MIRKRGASYVVTVYDPAKKGGKRWIGTFPSEREASKAEAQAKLDSYRRRDEEVTCGEFAGRWTTDYPRPRQTTNDHNAERVAPFARAFRDVPLNDITRKAARRWALDNPGRYSAVRAMFTDAVRDGLCDHNPFTNMGLPQSKGRKNITPPSMAVVADLAAKALELRGENFHAFILTAAYTGMRPGELYALQWPHIDFDDYEVHVAYSLNRLGELVAPKNGLTRTVTLPPPARDALLPLRQPEGFVFETHTGKRLTHRTISYQWNAVRDACGQHGLDLYMLRHAAASHLLNVMGIPSEQVASQLGHTDGGTLVRALYGHPSDEVARQAIKRAYANVVSLDEKRKTA